MNIPDGTNCISSFTHLAEDEEAYSSKPFCRTDRTPHDG